MSNNDKDLDLELLAKLTLGEGGERTGALIRAGYLVVHVTTIGHQAIARRLKEIEEATRHIPIAVHAVHPLGRAAEAVKTDKPRAYTADEMLARLLDQLEAHARYWAHTDLRKTTPAEAIAEAGGETAYRLEGLLHSFLSTLDGCTLDLPAFDLVPAPHEDDEPYNRERGENWCPTDGKPINRDVMLHEELGARRGRRR